MIWGETTVYVRADAVQDVVRYLHDDDSERYDYLSDVTAVEYRDLELPLQVVWHLRSLPFRRFLRLKAELAKGTPLKVPSVFPIYSGADWLERECYDMFGIVFEGHPDLRRILMWDGYPYFPLRKDFPLAGKPTDLPEVAFTKPAPLEGGPFVTVPGGKDALAREPRVRIPSTESVATVSRVERREDIRAAHEPDAPQPNTAIPKT